ncbi:unnamed protein product [Cyclocybe aegerita]|uniref:P-loop containing nucleoside triphosphate hydrolase protein n=1 Tax=Cyclocybe aegerita TaxID=1973307 RepID=A0A8S0WMN6_CYCAE|nr:unnamed protein product [Cyclocybe aegerita]
MQKTRQRPGYAYNMFQAAACIILVTYSILCVAKESTQWWGMYTVMGGVYLYCTALAFIQLLYGSFNRLARLYRNPQAHLTLVILSQYSVYAYRDLYPLATFSKIPLDYASEGRLLYLHVTILLVVGITIPLCRPCYRLRPPLQLEVILAAYCAPHCVLSEDELPALDHGDQAKVLKKRVKAEKRKGEHIFFVLVRSWWTDLLQLALLLIVHAGLSYVTPLGIERVLSYIEKGPQEDTFRLWFWIAVLLVGPVVASLILQWYIYVATRMVTQIEAALTQLVYKHALKMRAGATANSGADEETTKQSLNINSILTTDLFNIREARDFLNLGVYIPLHIGLVIVFLYGVLGFSAFVGLAVILAILPMPGYFASKIRDVEIVRMGKTDSRVGGVSEELVADDTLQFLDTHRNNGGYLHNLHSYLLLLQTLIMHQPLSASKVFSSMAVFDMLRGQFHLTFHTLAQVVTGKVSLDRLSAFLNETELLDRFSRANNRVSNTPSEGPVTQDSGPVKLVRGWFVWSESDAASSAAAISESSPSSSTTTISELPLVTDRAFVLNIDKDIQFECGSFTLVVGPTGSGKTVLLMAVLDEMHRLDSDAGDQTEVGEKGLMLSGGQKARVTLARVVYLDKEVLLLDDVLAALDMHTSHSRRVGGADASFLAQTHNVPMARTVATHIMKIGQGSKFLKHGPIDEVLPPSEGVSNGEPLLVAADETVEEDVGNVPSSSVVAVSKQTTKSGKLVVEEEVEVRHVNWNAMQTWYLGYWAGQYDTRPPEDINVIRYLSMYGGILTLLMLIYSTAYVVYIYGSLQASRTIHCKLIRSILGTTLRWLDTTRMSRVIARCTQDIGAVDGVISGMVQWLTELTVSMIVKLATIVIIMPIFLGPGLFVALFGGWLCQVYMSSQLSVKREMSNTKAPILAHFGAMMNGLGNVHMCVSLDILGSIFTSALAAYMVYFQSQSALNTGFSLNMLIAFSGMILYWVMFLNDLEVQGNSLERIQKYLEIEQEPKNMPLGNPPAYWPASGELVVEHLSSKYSEDGPEVLHDLSFRVNSGEHIGIVGRTGSGKSSLTLSLLWAIFTSGTVYYDGLETKSMNLDALRSSITIIPQVPEMLCGSVRQNLDPFNQYDDAQLNNALHASGLSSTSKEVGHSFTLDSIISSGRDNLSIRQHQILALARAIVRGCKLLILDEATSAIDHETNVLIQSMLRHKLGPDVTLLTVAHRLHTIMDADKIMVLDKGHIIEFDSPEALLEKENGLFKSLVDNSGDKDNLRNLAHCSYGVQIA